MFQPWTLARRKAYIYPLILSLVAKLEKKNKKKQHLENKGLLTFHSDLFHLGSCMSDFSHAVVGF